MLSALVLAVAAVAQTWQPITAPSRSGVATCIPGTYLMVFGGSGRAGTFGDTWLFDGTRWTALPAAVPPGLARESAEMVWDIVRNRVVLFGGRTAADQLTALDDLWEFDGSTWTPVPLALRPAARTQHTLVYDAYRARTVLFGGLSTALTNFGDTWEYDGSRWIPIQAATSPSPRVGMAAAFDLLRGVTAAHGGSSTNTTVFNDTWEYDAAGWRSIPVVGPPPAARSMCFDLTNNRIVLSGAVDPFVGGIGETWSYDGLSWRIIAGSFGPGAATFYGERMMYDWVAGAPTVWNGIALWRLGAAGWSLTKINSPGVKPRATAPFDAGRGCIVAYGKGRTFEYSQRQWRAVPTTGPSSSSEDNDMVFDSARGRIVLFGGRDRVLAFAVPNNETWEYDGSHWTQQNPPVRPPGRASHRMTFDSRRRRVVLFGGMQPMPYSVSWLADTWEYDGSAWTLVSAGSGPSARQGHSLVYDPSRDRTVLFGGGISGSATIAQAMYADTWEYDGAWHARSPVVSPAARAQHGGVYDPVRGRILIHGGISAWIGNDLGDLWQYDGNSWSQVATTPAPQVPHSYDVSYDVSLAVDSRTGVVTLYDLQTWELVEAPVPTSARYGRGCSQSGGPVPALDAAPASLPALGSAFTLQFSSLPGSGSSLYLAFGAGLAQWCGIPLPIPLDVLGLPQCQLWIPPDDGVFASATGSTANVTLPVPADPSLAGVLVGMQAAVLDAAAPSGIGALTNALALRLW